MFLISTVSNDGKEFFFLGLGKQIKCIISHSVRAQGKVLLSLVSHSKFYDTSKD